MIKSFSCLIFFLVFLQNIHNQSVERSLSAGFSTTTEIVKPYGDDKWLMAARGEPEPGAYYRDTLFLVIIGQDGQIHLRKNLLTPSSELHYWHDVLALPDGGILACFESTLCDVGADLLTIQRLDAFGNLIWEKTGGFVFGTPRPPEKWFLSPDGNLIGAGYAQIWKVNPSNGSIFWKADLEGVNAGMISAFEFALIHGTEDFFALGLPDFQIWRNNGDPVSPIYVLENSLELPGYRSVLTVGINGWYYCYQNFPDNRIERVNENFEHEILPITTGSTSSLSMADSKNGLYVAESLPYSPRLRRFDNQGLHEIELPDNLVLSPFCLAINNDWLAVTGAELLGALSLGSMNPFSKSSWVGLFPESAPILNGETPNAKVSEIEQLYSIDTTRFPAFPSGYVFNLFGGGFRVKITNLGNIPITQIGVNTSFGPNEFFDVCFNYPAGQKVFSNLNLAPGEFNWVDFGDIKADGQTEIPNQICFWTSSPNEQPDAVHEDDRACHPASYTVAVIDPDITHIKISPNPADGFADIFFAENLEGENWQIFDATGRFAAMGLCPNSQTTRLETGDLPNGFYIIRIKNRVIKLVVQH